MSLLIIILWIIMQLICISYMRRPQLFKLHPLLDDPEVYKAWLKDPSDPKVRTAIAEFKKNN